MLQPWPRPEQGKTDRQVEADINWLRTVTDKIRNIRSERNAPPGKQFPVYIGYVTSADRQRFTNDDQQRFASVEAFLKKLANIEEVHWLAEGEQPPLSASSLAGHLDIHVPMAGLIDKTAEIARLNKEIDRLTKEVERLNGKLANEKFVASAPTEVVDKEKAKRSDAEASLAKLRDQILNIQNL
jgi:valyl-tRNA synthetase